MYFFFSPLQFSWFSRYRSWEKWKEGRKNNAREQWWKGDLVDSIILGTVKHRVVLWSKL